MTVAAVEAVSQESLRQKMELARQCVSAGDMSAQLLALLAAISAQAAALNRGDIAAPIHALEEELQSSGKPSPAFLERCRVEIDRWAVQQEASLGEDPELLNDFILESRDHLAKVEALLLLLEKTPADGEAINSVFRSFHTIKGLAGFLDFPPIREVAHEIENVLDRAREGNLPLNTATIDLVLAAGDYIKTAIDALSRPPVVFPSNVGLINAIRGVGTAERAQPPVFETARPAQSSFTPAVTVKVNTAKMEYLLDMVGELVIAQSILRNNPALTRDPNPALSRSLTQLARVTDEVQKTALSMRMVPVRRLFANMERLVRDLGRKSGKRILFETAGEHAELDRNIVEELADPLVHMIRNSVDHGVEPPEEREALGKPASGTIRLQAEHEAGCIVIRLSDDGRGLDRARILAKARERGLASADSRLTDDETLRLIFQPGFSTAAAVTDISGRGVGMDVVLKHLQKLRGRVEIKSVRGEGCTFTLRLPLTLAIIDGLVTGVGAERFIVPIFSMREMFRASDKNRFTIEGKREMVLFRGSLLPVVRLRERFAIADDAEEHSAILIVVRGRDREFCIAVDRLIGKQEVVIKSLGSCFRDVPGIAGGAILGDGKVGLILDVDSLAGGAAPRVEAAIPS